MDDGMEELAEAMAEEELQLGDSTPSQRSSMKSVGEGHGELVNLEELSQVVTHGGGCMGLWHPQASNSAQPAGNDAQRSDVPPSM